MGGCQSKPQPVASAPPKSRQPPPQSVKKQSSKGSLGSQSGHRRSRKDDAPTKKSTKRSSEKNRDSPIRNGIVKKGAPADAQWKLLWEKYHPMLIDPADVHAVLEELMAQTTNELSTTEITLVQRRVRFVVRSLAASLNATSIKLSRFYSSSAQNNNRVESKAIAEKQHLLDETAIGKIFTGGDGLCKQQDASDSFWNFVPIEKPKPNGSSVDIIGSSYILMQYLCSDWDLCAQIAQQTASDLDMDVNRQDEAEASIMAPPLPLPMDPTNADPPIGVTLSSLSFLMALALRGTRYQRLHLLFYLLFPPKELDHFLACHPAGGVPTFLLEVGNDTIISVASLAHYYYYCKTLLPSKDAAFSETTMQNGGKEMGYVSACHAVDALATLLFTKESTQQDNSDGEAASSSCPKETDAKPQHSPARNNNSSSSSGYSSMFRRSSEKGDKEQWNGDSGSKSDWMEYLREVREGEAVSYRDAALEESKNLLMINSSSLTTGTRWTMKDFFEWAENALDNTALDAILHRVFATGILPSPSAEREMVLRHWVDWQRANARLWSTTEGDGGTLLDCLSQSVRTVFRGVEETLETADSGKVWGGLGGYDGKGGLGHGILYCIDKKWWDAWKRYVGWSWDGESVGSLGGKRPGDLSTERLLDRMSDSVVPGTLGSFEVMKHGLAKGVDYVLVPPIVWDMLYELYGGGPPLPRMVLPPMKMMNPRERTFSSDSKQMEEEDMAQSVEIVPSNNIRSPLKIPEEVAVATHPWILTAHVCDAQQPYRRGDAGPTSIRVMVTPDQPLWRLYAELIARLQVNNAKAADADGLGKARLWKRMDVSANTKDATCRYGPWTLLCKNRDAILPIMPQSVDRDNFSDLVEDWKAYADHATVESIGLTNNDRIMVEYAVINKNGDSVWPREAAAKAGRVRHLAAEDAKFRQMLRGVDENGKPLAEPPTLVGMSVDAMDQSGCWYQVEILQVENSDATDESEEESGEMESTEGRRGPTPYGYAAEKKEGESEVKQVRVVFSEHGGHSEWIDIDSDRLAKAGRFTMGSDDSGDTKANGGASTTQPSTDAKSKLAASGKKGGNDTAADQNGGGKVCTFPGYGACGLANLGNTCYANSALQCISYIPLLRAYLISGQYKTSGDLNKDNPLGTGGKLLEEFAELLRVMWSGKYGERTPTRFRSQLGKARSQFSGADQQDAQELLSYMLDVLHEDSNKVKKKPYVEALEDDWVKKNKLPRVGQEAWRRFLRRNRSIMADVTMGQVLNTVTCPVCHFSSRNFDPFNLLSLPFPTVADVVFQCTIIRRASAFNCPQTLNRPRKGQSSKARFEGSKTRSPKPPSEQLVFEQYVIAMSRLADIGDLRLQLQNISGVPANRFRLCRVEEVVVDNEADDTSPVRTYLKSTALPDKEGPCVQVAKKGSPDEEGSDKNVPTQIIAFESTLNPRPPQPVQNGQKGAAPKVGNNRNDEESSTTEDEEDDDESEARARTRSRRDHRALMELLESYGDSKECRIYDSDPLPISKAISRCLWPKTETEFKLGLRVDAIDHRNHWFSGSVVEIVEGVASEHGESHHDNENATKTKVRIHFDNFSSKWDETYTIDQFQKGQVRPLYSHATPRMKPTEFVVYHRYVDRKKKGNALFGRGFYLQCQNEWSTARAGAHILAQAARFMLRRSDSSNAVDVDDIDSQSKIRRIYDKAYSAISDLIDLLIDYDRQYMRSALGIDDEGDTSPQSRKNKDSKPFRKPSFDASTLSTALIEKVRGLLFRLPFEVRVCTADAPMGSKSGPSNEEVPFPFSLMRTIGNFMNARHAVVLHWRDPPMEKKSKHPPATYLNSPVMYTKPEIVVHKASLALLNDHEAKKTKNSPGSGGLHLGVCLTEFCKVQQLHLNDNWKCPRCKEFREGKQNMNLWKLPDVLTFHIKRFNCSARWREKITTKINFPLTGLDMSEWYHKESPAMHQGSNDEHVYDLIGVMNHYGGMTGGHYVATCKATACSADGSEEVAYNFNGVGTNFFGSEEETGGQTGWRLGRSKDKESATSQNKTAAAAAAKAASESAEPLWLQFDDDLVEPIPPRNVVSEMAYVLFYRRRHMTPSNIAKYSTIHC